MRQITISHETAKIIVETSESNQCPAMGCGGIVIAETLGGAAEINCRSRVFHSNPACMMALMATIAMGDQANEN